jgi:hypothetical protein
VTHVLTIGITTILITGLLVAGSGLLQGEKDDAQRSEMRTIGNRLASEMTASFNTASAADGKEVTMRVNHPKSVAGDTYQISVNQSCSGSALPNDPPCLVLSATGSSTEIKVALNPDMHTETPPPLSPGDFVLEETTVNGGEFFIIIEDYDNDDVIEIRVLTEASPKLAPLEVGE